MPDFRRVFSRFKINRYFIILLIICLLAGYQEEILLLFTFVLLHELCHVIAAKIYKLKLYNIEIFPFGGVARIDNLEDIGTFKEIVITIAGPLFNLTTAMVLFFLNMYGITVPFHDYLLRMNVLLAFFNLLPGMPLDGGRIIKAVLKYFVGYKKAVKAAIMSGKVIAGILFSCGIIVWISGKPDINLLIMPFFLFISAAKEESAAMFTIIKDFINKKQHFKNSRIMEAKELCVYKDTSVTEVLKYFDLGRYHIIMVIGDDMKIESVMTESEVFDNLTLDLGEATIGELSKKIKK